LSNAERLIGGGSWSGEKADNFRGIRCSGSPVWHTANTTHCASGKMSINTGWQADDRSHIAAKLLIVQTIDVFFDTFSMFGFFIIRVLMRV